MFVWTVSAPPVPAAVSCGQTLTHSTLVQNDLFDCLGNGLVAGAAGITIDLGGHTIDGTGLGSGVLGVGFASVIVTNGVLQEFDRAVTLGLGADQSIVTGITSTLNQEFAIAIEGADGVTIRESTITGNVSGIVVLEATGAHVHHNVITLNSADGARIEGGDGHRIERNLITESSGPAVSLVDADGNIVVDNTLTGNDAGVVVGEVDLPSNDNVVERNDISLSSSAGVEVIGSNGTRIVGNTINEGGSVGVALDTATSSVVEGNDLRFNAGAISLEASTGNVIHRNDAGSSNGTGISLEALSLDNAVTANRASGNSGEGIYVGDAATAGDGNLIDGNTASNNSGAGINVNGTGHTISNNVVELNDGWGIFAVPGNIDGGGNVAAGNIEPAQCSGVVCTIGIAPGAPDTYFVLTPPNPSNSQNAVFTFSGTDNTTPIVDLGFQCRLDGTDELDWVDCENPWEITGLSPGPHRLEVRAVDQGEAVDPTPAVYEWTYDALPGGVAPDTFIDIAPPPSSPLLEGVFTFSSNELDVTFECRLDSTLESAWEDCVFVYEFAFEEFDVGQHTFQVRATDFEGNTDPTPATYDWTVTGLVTTVTNGPAYVPPAEPGEPAEGGETEDRTATFEFAANLADATFMCSLDLGSFVPCTSPVTYTGLQVGEHVFTVFAEDPEGEQLQVEPTEYGWVILSSLDETPPVAVVTGAGTDANGALRFVFSATDNVTSPQGLVYECTLTPDGGLAIDLGECVSPLTLPNFEHPDPIPAGDYTFSVVALDSNDNASEPAGASVLGYAGDTVAPAPPTIAPLAAQTGLLEIAIAFAAVDDQFVTFECSVGAIPDPVHQFEPCEPPASVQVDLPGAYEFAVRATDLSGNTGSTSTATWEVVPQPVMTFTAALPPLTTPDTLATFAFVADQPGVSYACTLEGPLGTTTAACSSPATYADLAPGEHTFAVTATNVALGLVSDSLEHTWVVEGPPAEPPMVSIDSVPATPTLETTATFSFSADQSGAAFFCALEPPEPAVFAPCVSPVTHTGLVAGVWPGTEYTFSVYAVVDGLAGAPVDFEWAVTLPPPDTTPPATSLVSGPPAITAETSASFSFASNEAGSTFECSLDGGTFATCTSPATLTGLLAGAHTFAVQAVDPSGNVDSSPLVHIWEVQVPPPDCSTVLTLNASADAWVDQGSASTNKGTDSVLKVMSKSSNKNLRTLVDFNIPSAPAGCIVDSATLRLNATSYRNGRTLRVEPLSGPWSEGSVNWTNKPGVTGAASTTSSGSGWRQWDVTAQVATWFDTGVHHGFQIRDNQENSDHEQQFRSREGGSNPPQLVVTFAPAPAPDTSPPETVITSGPSDGDSTNVSFSFTGTDAVSAATALAYECRLDGLAWAACASPVNLAGLDRVVHTFSVRAVDEAANVDPSPATHSWTVTADTTAPTATITSSPPASTSATAATFAFASSESGSSFMCRLDGGAWEACSSSHIVNDLALGVHTLAVYAVDLSGNGADAMATSFTWEVIAFVDCGSPVTITTNADAWIDSSSTSQNKGSDSVLKVMSKSGGNNRAIVDFNLPTAPVGCVVESATLQMYAKSARSGRTLQALALGSSWIENTVTWANQPATTGAAATTNSGAGWREWAVAEQVTAMYASGGHHGFLVRDASENNDHEQQFDARESGSNAPRLVIVFSAP
jgi:hypothetical protein